MKHNSFDNFIKNRDQLVVHKISNSKDLRGKNRNGSDDTVLMSSVNGSVASFSLGQALNPDYIKKERGAEFLKKTLIHFAVESKLGDDCKTFLNQIDDQDIIKNADNIGQFLIEESKKRKYSRMEFSRWFENSIKNSKIIYDIGREGIEQGAGAYEKQYIKPEKLINFVQNRYFCNTEDLKSIIEDVVFKKKQASSGKKQQINDVSDVANLEKTLQILTSEEVEKLISYIKGGPSDPEIIRELLTQKVLNNPKIIPSLGYAKVLNNPTLANVFNKVVKFREKKGSLAYYEGNLEELNENIKSITDLSLKNLLENTINTMNNPTKDDQIKNLNSIYQNLSSDAYKYSSEVQKIKKNLKTCIEDLSGGSLMEDEDFKSQFFKDGKIQHNINTDSWISSDSKPQDSGIRNFAKKIANGITSSFNLNNRNGANKKTKAVGIAISIIVALITLIALLTNPGFAAMSISAKVLGITIPLALPVLTTGLTALSTLRGNRKITNNSSKFIDTGLKLSGTKDIQNEISQFGYNKHSNSMTSTQIDSYYNVSQKSTIGSDSKINRKQNQNINQRGEKSIQRSSSEINNIYSSRKTYKSLRETMTKLELESKASAKGIANLAGDLQAKRQDSKMQQKTFGLLK